MIGRTSKSTVEWSRNLGNANSRGSYVHVYLTCGLSPSGRPGDHVIVSGKGRGDHYIHKRRKEGKTISALSFKRSVSIPHSRTKSLWFLHMALLYGWIPTEKVPKTKRVIFLSVTRNHHCHPLQGFVLIAWLLSIWIKIHGKLGSSTVFIFHSKPH